MDLAAYSDDTKTGTEAWSRFRELRVVVAARVKPSDNFEWVDRLEHAARAFSLKTDEVKSPAIFQATGQDKALASILEREVRSVSIHLVDIFIRMEEILSPLLSRALFPGMSKRQILVHVLNRSNDAQTASRIAQQLAIQIKAAADFSKYALMQEMAASRLLQQTRAIAGSTPSL